MRNHLAYTHTHIRGGSVAEWLACWTHAQKGPGSNYSLRQTVHTHCASVHQPANLVAALLSFARVTAGLAESNGSLLPGLWLTSPAGWLPRTGINSGTLRLSIEYWLPLPFLYTSREIRKIRQICWPNENVENHNGSSLLHVDVVGRIYLYVADDEDYVHFRRNNVTDLQ